MFNTLESTWDQSNRRGWSTLVSFTMQVLALSLLLAVSLIWVGRPPQIQWLQISAPASFMPDARPSAEAARGHRATTVTAAMRPGQIVAPQTIPLHTLSVNDVSSNLSSDPSAPDLPMAGFDQNNTGGDGIPAGLGNMPVAVPTRPVAVRPLLVSHLSEANLLHRVQPVYPPLARQARVQGSVELRAIISKTGTIKDLIVVRGHPFLAPAAVEAVRQWRYRPYVLNNEPIEVETDITVNFLLAGG